MCSLANLEDAFNNWLIDKKTFGMPNKASIHYVDKMVCPICKHKWLLPIAEIKNGFKKCPKCGYEK